MPNKNKKYNPPVAVGYFVEKSASRIYGIAEQLGESHPDFKELHSICDELRWLAETYYSEEVS